MGNGERSWVPIEKAENSSLLPGQLRVLRGWEMVCGYSATWFRQEPLPWKGHFQPFLLGRGQGDKGIYYNWTFNSHQLGSYKSNGLRLIFVSFLLSWSLQTTSPSLMLYFSVIGLIWFSDRPGTLNLLAKVILILQITSPRSFSRWENSKEIVRCLSRWGHLATKCNDLTPISRSHMVEGESWPPQAVTWLPHTHPVTRVFTHVYTINR